MTKYKFEFKKRIVMDYINGFPVISGGMDRPMSFNMVGAMSHSRPPPAKEETGVSAI